MNASGCSVSGSTKTTDPSHARPGRSYAPVVAEAAILVVDDDPPILRMLGRTLEAEGYAVSAAADGGAALAAVERSTPDLLVLDVAMPGVDGLAVCRRLRSIIRRFPEVTSVISQAGRPEDGTDPKPINMVEIFVDLKPQSEWTRRVAKEELVVEMQAALEEIPGVRPSFSQPIRDNVLESISQIDGQIVIKVYGEEPSLLRERAQTDPHARAYTRA